MKRILASFLCTAITLTSMSGIALADTEEDALDISVEDTDTSEEIPDITIDESVTEETDTDDITQVDEDISTEDEKTQADDENTSEIVEVITNEDEVVEEEEIPAEEETPVEEELPTEEVPVEDIPAEEEEPTEEIPVEEELPSEEETPVEEVIPDVKADFVSRLYKNFLSREAEKDEIDAWIELLNDGFTGADIVVGFSISPEFVNKSLSNSEYIDVLYQTVLGREADENGKAVWLDMLNFRQTREAVLSCFISSPEFNDICSEYGIVTGSYITPFGSNYMLENFDVSSFVARLYRICLGREYDDDGIIDWVSTLKSGKKGGGDVAIGFLHSKEFYNLRTSNTEYVKILYRTLMGREADKEGLDYWVNCLKNGDSRDTVLNQFIYSPEFSSICDDYGISVMWNPHELYPEASNVLDEIGWDLKAALDWASMPYLRFETDPDLGIRFYANYGFTNHKGNCYVMASCFTEMALALGFNPVQVSGIVPLRVGGMGPHSWVYIDDLIYDPDYQKESGNSGFGITYGTPGTWRYTDPVPMS